MPPGPGVSGAQSAKAHPPHVSLLSQPGTRPGIRPVIRKAPGWRTGTNAPAFLLPSGHRLSLPGRPVPARESGLPYGRLAGSAQAALPDPDGVPTFRTHEMRPGRMSSSPRGRRCSLRPSGRPRSPSAALQRLAPATPELLPARDVMMTRHQQRFRFIHPSGPPLACDTRPERAPLGFPLSFAPGRYQPRTSGRGRIWNTNPKSRLRLHAEPPIDELTHDVRPRVAPSGHAALTLVPCWAMVTLGPAHAIKDGKGRTRCPRGRPGRPSSDHPGRRPPAAPQGRPDG